MIHRALEIGIKMGFHQKDHNAELGGVCTCLLRMYCIDIEALVFMFNGGSSYGFAIHPMQYILKKAA